MKYFTYLFIGIAIAILSSIACKKTIPKPPAENEVMDAPIKGLSAEQLRIFMEGAEEFDEVYTTETGLGPIFVATSCGGCHAGDNKGHPSTILTRFGQTDSTGNHFLAYGAPQLQHRALPGFEPERLPAGATFTKLIAPIAAGLGYLEAVSDADILAMSDPNDSNGDGISGVPNWNTIPDFIQVKPDAATQNGKYICRFGRKASTYNLHQQTAGAFVNDIGITSTYFPQNPVNFQSGSQPIATSDPDLSDRSIMSTVFYMQAIQAPLRRNETDAEIVFGSAVFHTIGCASCHKPMLRAGYSPIAQISGKEFYPYTDLLLHDMGDDLNDQYTDGSALASEWRTTPLWGLGLSADAQGGKMFLLHDGRASTFEQAIDFHGGEGSMSRALFKSLDQSQKDVLIKFLYSL